MYSVIIILKAIFYKYYISILVLILKSKYT